MVYHFVERSDKSVEVFFVQENFMAFVAISVFPARTFRDGDKKVVSFGFFNIQEISAAFSGSYTFGKYTFFLFAIATIVVSFAKSTTETAATATIVAATKAATVAAATPEIVVAFTKTAPIASSVALVAATVAVAIMKVVVSPFKIPEFHLSECFMKKNV
jgi:hypothetical protein